MHNSSRKYIFLFAVSSILTITGIFFHSRYSEASLEEDELTTITSKIETQIDISSQQLKPVLDLLIEDESIDFTSLNVIETTNPYYVFNTRGELVYWSTNEYVPSYIDLIGDYKLKYIETRKGKFISLKTKRGPL